MNEQPAPTSNRPDQSSRFFNRVQRYKNLVQRRWWVLPLGLAAGLAVQGYRLWKSPPAFASVGRMIVGIKINTQQIGAGYMEELTQFLGTQAALMRSARVVEKAYDRVKALKPKLSPVPVQLQISISPKTTIFNLQATGGEPEYTRAYLDACMEEYILLKKDMRTSTSDSTLANLTEQVTSLERDIKKYEQEEITFKTTNNVALIQEQGNYAAKYLVQLSSRRDAFKTELQFLTLLNLDQNLERQQNKTALTATGGVELNQNNTPLSLLNADYFKARQDLQLRKAELQEWSQYLKPKHPRMVLLAEDIKRRENLVAILKEQSQEQLQDHRESIALQIQNLEDEIKDWEVKSLDVSMRMADYERIRAAKQRVQNLYDRLLVAMQSIGVDKDISQESVTVLERATPAFPARDNPVTVLIIGAAVGLLGGLAILLLVDRLDDRPTSFADLKDAFDESVLGQIPLEMSPNRKMGVQLLRPEDQRHAFQESYRNLRSTLFYMTEKGKRPRVVVVTSAIPGDGKSMTAANLATTMALSGARVVLVDGDLRKGALHQAFNVEATPGLHEVLSGPEDWRKAIQSTKIANLSLMPRGRTTSDPGAVLLSTLTHKLVIELAANFDYVIFDSPPVMAADDVTSFSSYVEGVLFVIRANYTSGRIARAALDQLYQRRVNVLGLVFNGVDPHAADYYYYSYKDYYADPKSA